MITSKYVLIELKNNEDCLFRGKLMTSWSFGDSPSDFRDTMENYARANPGYTYVLCEVKNYVHCTGVKPVPPPPEFTWTEVKR